MSAARSNPTSPTSRPTPSGGLPFVYVVAAVAAVGGLLFGYDTGVISGALLFIKLDFRLSAFQQEVVVSAVLLGATLGAISGGWLADTFGRRRLLIATGAIFAAGAIGAAFAISLAWLIVGRMIVGLGIGFASFTAPLYISEVAPPAARGWLVSLNQLAITLGIVVSYLVDYAFAGIDGWRWMLGLAVIPGIALIAGMLLLPESPRWLVGQGRVDAARAVLTPIRAMGGFRRVNPVNPVDSGNQGDPAGDAAAMSAPPRDAVVEGELHEIGESLTHEQGSWSEVFGPFIRPALIVGVGLAVFQQVTGINTVIYYAPTILRTAGFSTASGAILATAGVGVVNVVMTVVALRLIDRLGRRILLLVGLVGMFLALAVLGLAFALPRLSSGLSVIAVASLMVYVGAFAIGLGPIFWLLIAEIYPLRMRGRAMSVATTLNWGSNLLVALTFLTLVQALGSAATFWLYALLTVGAWVFTYFLVPETKGRTLEQIQASWHQRESPEPPLVESGDGRRAGA